MQERAFGYELCFTTDMTSISATSASSPFAAASARASALAERRQANFLASLSATERVRLTEREQAAKSRLLALGVEAAEGGGPKGFPTGTSWVDAQNMVTRNKVTGVTVNSIRLQNALGRAIQEDARRTVARPERPPLTAQQQAAEDEAKAFLKEAGIAEDPEGQPRGFPSWYRWADLRKLATTNRVEGIEIDETALRKTLQATQALAEIGVTDIRPPLFRSGTSVLSALDQVMRENRNGITVKALRAAGMELSDFPRPTTVYEAYKTVEDPQNALGIDEEKAAKVKADYQVLKNEGIFSIQKFRPFGARDASDAVALFKAEPTKFYEMTNTPPPSKPRWKVPPLFNAPRGASSAQVRALALENAIKANPDYSRAEVMAKFGFDRIKRLG
jgi:hypothetical protein